MLLATSHDVIDFLPIRGLEIISHGHTHTHTHTHTHRFDILSGPAFSSAFKNSRTRLRPRNLSTMPKDEIEIRLQKIFANYPRP